MNNVYDNGYKLLGTKKDLVNYIHNNMLTEEDDEANMEMLEELSNFKDKDIVCINYDFGMGFTYETWKEQDKVV